LISTRTWMPSKMRWFSTTSTKGTNTAWPCSTGRSFL
jgi:hypothetical protein